MYNFILKSYNINLATIIYLYKINHLKFIIICGNVKRKHCGFHVSRGT